MTDRINDTKTPWYDRWSVFLRTVRSVVFENFNGVLKDGDVEFSTTKKDEYKKGR